MLFDRGARALLDRAYARPGVWAGTRVAAPTPAQVAHFAGQGINVLGRDEVGRDRWAAGFVRAVYHQHKWYRRGRGWSAQRRMVPYDGRAIRYELGRMLPVLGVIPAGRAVRIRSVPGGQAAERAARKLPGPERILLAGGHGPAATLATDRDWQIPS